MLFKDKLYRGVSLSRSCSTENNNQDPNQKPLQILHPGACDKGCWLHEEGRAEEPHGAQGASQSLVIAASCYYLLRTWNRRMRWAGVRTIMRTPGRSWGHGDSSCAEGNKATEQHSFNWRSLKKHLDSPESFNLLIFHQFLSLAKLPGRDAGEAGKCSPLYYRSGGGWGRTEIELKANLPLTAICSES